MKTNWIMWDFVDNDGVNPLSTPATFECEISFTYDPTAAPQIELDTVNCVHISTDDGDRLPTLDEKELLNPWVTEVIAAAENLQFQIKTAALHNMTLE